ncbi:MAG: hypothetical protein ACFFD4_17405 [Candidatus Odinarchaeota archaeon]
MTIDRKINEEAVLSLEDGVKLLILLFDDFSDPKVGKDGGQKQKEIFEAVSAILIDLIRTGLEGEPLGTLRDPKAQLALAFLVDLFRKMALQLENDEPLE